MGCAGHSLLDPCVRQLTFYFKGLMATAWTGGSGEFKLILQIGVAQVPSFLSSCHCLCPSQALLINHSIILMLQSKKQKGMEMQAQDPPS